MIFVFFYDIVQHMPTGHNDLCFYDDNVQHVPTGHNDLCFVMTMFSACQLDTMILVL